MKTIYGYNLAVKLLYEQSKVKSDLNQVIKYLEEAIQLEKEELVFKSREAIRVFYYSRGIRGLISYLWSSKTDNNILIRLGILQSAYEQYNEKLSGNIKSINKKKGIIIELHS